MSTYTIDMENELFETMPMYEEEEECKDLIDVLNSAEFRTFGEALRDIIRNKKRDASLNEMEYLISCSKEKNIVIADNRMIKRWFTDDKRPKNGPKGRFTMFKIAFSLELSEDETKKLFETVYLDRAYNPRDYKDVVYFYCLRNKKSLTDANRIIDSISFSEDKEEDKTLHTQVLLKQLTMSEKESDLVEYISTHPHNFKINNVTAMQKKQEYLEEAKEIAKEERKKYDDLWIGGGSNELGYSAGRNQDSTNFLYETITGCEIQKDRGTKFTFKNATLPKEIKNCFPTPHTLSEKNPSYEELRKLIILLISYVYWSKMDAQDSYQFDDYRVFIDMVLDEIGYLPLYAGNPYDWLFLRCTLSEHPLELFRDILYEVLH